MFNMRAPFIPPNQLSTEQRSIYDDVKSVVSSHLKSFETETKDGALMGPWAAWLHELFYGGPIWILTKILTVNTILPQSARQVAIL